jgi:hypothetical protein
MNILETAETTTTIIMVTLMPIGKHRIFFANDYIEIEQKMRFERASANIDLASMQNLADSQFKVRFVKEYFDDKTKREFEDPRRDTLFENPSNRRKTDNPNQRNFEITIHQQELQFSKLYALYMREAQPIEFSFSIDLDLYRDQFRYLGSAMNGVESYLLNDIRDSQNFGCKFKIQTYFFGAFIGDG